MTDETNKSSEKQESQEALAPAEEKAPVSEPVVPLHEHTALRGRAQAAELEAANLKGQITQLQEQKTTLETVKSPLDIAKEAYIVENGNLVDFALPVELYEQQEAFKKQQAEQVTVANAKQVRTEAQLASRELAIVAHPDWQTVVNTAVKLMTKGEILDLEAEGENFGETIYAKSQKVLERVKPVETTALKKELSEQEVKEKKEAEEAKKAENIPSQTDILANASPAAKAAYNL